MIQVRQCSMVPGDFFAPAWENKLGIGLRWLGQAGFAMTLGAARGLIDPYLSDSLAVKYRGSQFPHVRLTPPPIAPQDVPAIEFVACTHRHSDHMDPGTLPIIAARHPQCRFVVPRAETKTALNMGLPARQIIGMDAGESLQLTEKVRLSAIPAAHEDLARNEKGEYVALGYIFETQDVRIYHSGDCVPYPGLSDRLQSDKIDIALLPVNGRSAGLASRGIPGNFTWDEAAALCHAARIPWMLPHHFGMFAFNTVDAAEIGRRMAEMDDEPRCLLPDTAKWVKVESLMPDDAPGDGRGATGTI